MHSSPALLDLAVPNKAAPIHLICALKNKTPGCRPNHRQQSAPQRLHQALKPVLARAPVAAQFLAAGGGWGPYPPPPILATRGLLPRAFLSSSVLLPALDKQTSNTPAATTPWVLLLSPDHQPGWPRCRILNHHCGSCPQYWWNYE